MRDRWREREREAFLFFSFFTIPRTIVSLPSQRDLLSIIDHNLPVLSGIIPPPSFFSLSHCFPVCLKRACVLACPLPLPVSCLGSPDRAPIFVWSLLAALAHRVPSLDLVTGLRQLTLNALQVHGFLLRAIVLPFWRLCLSLCLTKIGLGLNLRREK